LFKVVMKSKLTLFS